MSDCGRLYGDGLYGDCYYGGAEPTIPGWVDYPGINSNYMRVLDTPSLEVPAITIVTKVRANSWNPVGNKGITARFVGPLVFRMIILSGSGNLYFGTYNSSGVEAAQNAGPPGGFGAFTDPDGWVWIAASRLPDNGAGQRVGRLYYSTYGDTWVEYSTAIVATPSDIRMDSTSQLSIGAVGAGDQTWPGDIAYLSIRNGVGPGSTIGGTEVFRFGAEELAVDPLAPTITAATGQTIEVIRAGVDPLVIVPSIPGACEPCFSNTGCPEQVPFATGPRDRTRDLVPCPPGGDC